MDPRRLGLVLILGGAAALVLAVVWFAAAYADAMDMAGSFAGDDYASRLMACLYSSAAMCQGAAMLSDGPAYSPAVFWIGVAGLLGGIVVRLAAARGVAPGRGGEGAPAAGDAGQAARDEILGFVPPAQFARYSYILALCGAVGGLLLTPLALVALAGFVLALLGLTVYGPRLTALDTNHLGVLCLVFVAAAVLLFMTRGTFLFLLAALAQIAAFYVGFNSYRHRRTINAQNVKGEMLLALKPGSQPLPDQQRPEPQQTE